MRSVAAVDQYDCIGPAKEQAGANSLYKLVTGIDPANAEGRDPAILFLMVDRALERLQLDLTDPIDRAPFLHLFGDLLFRFDEQGKGLALLEQGLTLSREGMKLAKTNDTVPRANFEAVVTLVQGCQRMSDARLSLGNLPEALALSREAHEVAAEYLPPDEIYRLFAEQHYAALLQRGGQLEEAHTVLAAAIGRSADLNVDLTPTQLADLYTNFGLLEYERASQAHDRAPLARSALAAFQAAAAHGADANDANRQGKAAHYAGLCHYLLGELDAALASIDNAVAAYESLTGGEHQWLLASLEMRAILLHKLARVDEAIKQLEQLLVSPADDAASIAIKQRAAGYLDTFRMEPATGD